MLVQSFGRELLVVDYALNKARITRLYCVNKARPRLHCNGRCYLAQKLRKAAETEKKAPAGPEKVKYEVLPTAAAFVPRRPQQWPAPTPRFAALRGSCYAFAPVRGVFHPPAVRA
ncbi:hypothetical protein Q5H93_21835 [Hymenobacter sp. ASUV-10]|uniref:Uncharacterized protein n=2 Tax=Hymenobacter aranciens TaxID=3063996 RepID=A0ABT9BGK4_9BACT|nr:hypothetical protein [Hymenobacter sp. ASUV-10]MDO7877397.1 hypothetical protein [Hymenobacter sp. ASUV-10]